ncbi:hypothetical protein SAMN04488696_0271 [Methanolobus profundi]|uniref:Uncharacterized protein n=1 Tax=Methanolobus profundi TaxID=487685 RepID=A0A1I4NV81_9EURY|nr:hypothetical protein SAMN04488696_0271 [Methanolobus profundi]
MISSCGQFDIIKKRCQKGCHELLTVIGEQPFLYPHGKTSIFLSSIFISSLNGCNFISVCSHIEHALFYLRLAGHCSSCNTRHILQAIQALPCILEIEPFLQEIFLLQSAKCISDSSWRQITFLGNFLLSKGSAILENLKDKFCRRWKSLYCFSYFLVCLFLDIICYLYFFSVSINKNDPSFQLLLFICLSILHMCWNTLITIVN